MIRAAKGMECHLGLIDLVLTEAYFLLFVFAFSLSHVLKGYSAKFTNTRAPSACRLLQ